MKKSKRKLTALHTLEVIKNNGYTNAKGIWIDLKTRQYNTIEYTHLYKPEALQTLIHTHQAKETGYRKGKE